MSAWKSSITGAQLDAVIRDCDPTMTQPGAFEPIATDSLYQLAYEVRQLRAGLEQASDVAMKATLCAQIMLQNPEVVANEKARHICVDTRDTANRFLASVPGDAAEEGSKERKA